MSLRPYVTIEKLGSHWLHPLQREPERRLWSGTLPADYKMAVKTIPHAKSRELNDWKSSRISYCEHL